MKRRLSYEYKITTGLKLSKMKYLAEHLEKIYPDLDTKYISLLTNILSVSSQKTTVSDIQYLYSVIGFNNNVATKIAGPVVTNKIAGQGEGMNFGANLLSTTQLFNYTKWKAQISIIDTPKTGRLHGLLISDSYWGSGHALQYNWSISGVDGPYSIKTLFADNSSGIYFRMRYNDITNPYLGVYLVEPNVTTLISPLMFHTLTGDLNLDGGIIIRMFYDGATFKYKVTEASGDAAVYADTSFPYTLPLKCIVAPILYRIDTTISGTVTTPAITIMPETNW